MKKLLLLRACQILCIVSFFFLLTHSELVSFYAKEGLSAWAFSVLPVLLPFIILSKFWIYYDIPQLFYQTAKKALPGHSQAALSSAVLLLGLSSGFPVGAIFVEHFYKKGTLSKNAAEELLPLCSFISPMFLMGYVRPLTNYHGKLWICFAISLYLPLFLTFGKNLIAKKLRQTGFLACQSLSMKETEKAKKGGSIRDIWLSSLEIILTIGVYMMLFSILFGLILDEPAFRAPIMQFLLSNMEITTGISWLSNMDAFSGVLRGTLMVAAVSFGGLCTAAQVQSIVSGHSFSVKHYLSVKIKCALLSAAFFLLLATF